MKTKIQTHKKTNLECQKWEGDAVMLAANNKPGNCTFFQDLNTVANNTLQRRLGWWCSGESMSLHLSTGLSREPPRSNSLLRALDIRVSTPRCNKSFLGFRKSKTESSPSGVKPLLTELLLLFLFILLCMAPACHTEARLFFGYLHHTSLSIHCLFLTLITSMPCLCHRSTSAPVALV